MKHIFNRVLLRKYDVRGVYGGDLNEEDAYFFGLTYATFSAMEFEKNNGENGKYKKKIVVGYDGRVSSPTLHKQLIQGILDAGVDVVDLGLVSSPMVCYGAELLNAISCVATTASHNPKEYNGFKFDFKGKPFFDEQILHLAEMAKEIEKSQKQGEYSKYDIANDYISHILNGISVKSGMRVLFDCGNGATGDIIKKLCQTMKEKYNIVADAIFTDIDGNFPNHHPDPTVRKNMEILTQKVIEGKYDLGIGFDGDGDRIGIIDNKGQMLYGDQILLILAKEIIKTHPHAKIVAEVKASKVVYDGIRKVGGVPIMSKIGHTYIRKVMDEEGALLGGETSGHIFFNDKFNGVDDAIYVAMRMIDILAKNDKKMSDFLAEIPTTFCTHDLKLEIDESDKFAIIGRIAENLKNDGKNFNDLDGVRIDTDDGWWMVRASNTQNVLVGRCESETKEGLETLKVEFEKYLKQAGYRQKINFDD